MGLFDKPFVELTAEQMIEKLSNIPKPLGEPGKCACGTEKVRVLTDLDNYASEWDCPKCQPLECVDYVVGIWVRTAGGKSKADFH